MIKHAHSFLPLQSLYKIYEKKKKERETSALFQFYTHFGYAWVSAEPDRTGKTREKTLPGRENEETVLRLERRVKRKREEEDIKNSGGM